jgi:hypothetical protein
LITDSWVSPKSIFGRLPGRDKAALSGRFHEELTLARVTAFNIALFHFELLARARRLCGWEKVIARNTYEEPDYALQCVAATYRVMFIPIVTIHHHYSGAVRSEMPNHRRHARNEL